MGVEEHTEYEGGGVMPNTVFPEGTDALTPSDKLRLISITGQENDSQAAPDPGFWYGNAYFDPNAKPIVDRERAQQQRAIKRESIARYRETPRSQY